MSTLDSAWVMTAGYDGLAAHNSPAWMSLYLAVCKLLDLALVLPAHMLPQFQMYRWAFVSEGGGSETAAATVAAAAASAPAVHNGDLSDGGIAQQEGQHLHLPQQDFVPYVVRVAKLLLHKVRTGYPIRSATDFLLWEFRHVAHIAAAQAAKLPNKNQQNLVADLSGHP